MISVSKFSSGIHCGIYYAHNLLQVNEFLKKPLHQPQPSYEKCIN